MARIIRTEYTGYNDDGTTRTAQMDFFVITDNRMDNPLNAIGTSPDPVSIPAMHSTHPFDTGRFFPAKVDKRTVTPMDRTGLNWKVSLDFSSDGRFRFQPNIDKTLPIRLAAESFHPAEVKYPVLTQRPVVTLKRAPTTPGGAAEWDIRFDWQRQDGIRQMFPENYQVKVVLGQTGAAGVYDNNSEAQIRKQIGRFHYLSTHPYVYSFPAGDLLAPRDTQWPTDYLELWQFNGCDVTQMGPATWHLTYSWTRDPGNNRIAPDGYVPGAPGNTAVYPLARPPFFRYQVEQPTPLLNADGTITQVMPKIIVVPTYSADDITGYQGATSLPGAPV